MDDGMWLSIARAIRDLDEPLLFEIYVRLLTILDGLEKQHLIRRTLDELLAEPGKLREIS